MRTLHKTVASLGILTVAGWTGFAGCSADAGNCADNNICLQDGTPVDGGTGDDGGPPPPPPGCENSPSDPTGDVLRDECGYFVSKTLVATGADGSMAKPFNTIDAALKAGAKARIYLCADGEYPERLDVKAGVSIFGALDCAGGEWKYNGATRSRINPAAPTDPAGLQASVRIAGNGTSKLEDLEIVAADAKLEGGSSIALIVVDATVTASRDSIQSNAAMDGPNAMAWGVDLSLAGAAGLPGLNACDGDLIAGAPGGAATMKTCGVDAVNGGKGGDGGLIQAGNPPTILGGGDGVAGSPADGGGSLGTGEPQAGGSCIAGGNGGDGTDGNAGKGAQTLGSIDINGFTAAAPGASGTPGTFGKGGGGGGGARGGTNICSGNKSGTGASGGSGGSGGCGGQGGMGGAGGGASIAVVSLNGKVTLTDSELKAGQAGNGGAGSAGQNGGSGGVGGNKGAGAGGSKAACAGGDGGRGGNGGPGGGGSGGLSLGVAYKGTAPTKAGATSITPGMPGTGGQDGLGGTTNKGVAGTAEEMKSF